MKPKVEFRRQRAGFKFRFGAKDIFTKFDGHLSQGVKV